MPVYKLLGGKVRDKVRVYNGSIRRKRTGDRPEDYAADVKWMMELPENFFMVKQGISFHSNMKDTRARTSTTASRQTQPATTAPWTRA